MRATIDLQQTLAGHVPTLSGPAHHLVGEGTEQDACAAAVTHTRCVIRQGRDGVWRAWQRRWPAD